MSNWLLHLPVVWMGLVILAGVYAGAAAIHFVVGRLAVGDRALAFKAVSHGVMAPLATIFALLVGFLAAQVWSDTDRASTAVNREASSLRAVVLLAGAFPGEPETRLRSLISGYIVDAVSNEWPQMERGNASLTIVPPKLTEALRLALALEPKGDGQVAAQREMVAALQTAFDARRQRIILSRSSINWVKWTVLLVQAGLLLVAIAMIHVDNRATSGIILTVFATGIGAAVILIASHSRPFTGEIAVRPAVMLQVMPEADTAR